MKMDLLAVVINAIIALIALGTLQYQRLYNRRLMDYSFHPIFKLIRFCHKNSTHWTPEVCDGANPDSKHTCTKDHWFDLINISNGIAFDLTVTLLNTSEIKNTLDTDKLKSRNVQTSALLKDGVIQYSLPIDAIPFSLFKPKTSDIFFVILEYRTVNGFKSFVQIAQLSIRPNGGQTTITDWKQAIVIFNPTIVSLLELNWYHNKKKRIKDALLKAKELAI